MAFDFIGKRYLYLIFSLLITVPGVLSLAAFGLKAGIEFTSGTTMQIKFTGGKVEVTHALAVYKDQRVRVQVLHTERDTPPLPPRGNRYLPLIPCGGDTA